MTIGENTVVGAGSVVTRDLPAGVVAMGNGSEVALGYFEEPEPYVDDEEYIYTDADRPLVNRRTYVWNHGIGETVTALLRHGLVLESLVEHDWTVWRHFQWLVPTDDGTWTSPPGRPRIPLSFSLLARRPR